MLNTPLQMLVVMLAGWVFGSIMTPDTILRWHRVLIARKYDGSDFVAERTILALSHVNREPERTGRLAKERQQIGPASALLSAQPSGSL